MIKVYVAGKVSKESVFGTHHWRDNFCRELSQLSGLEIENLDPTKSGADHTDPKLVFGCDCYTISTCDVVVVYLSDDISVGGSQEILVAKYFKKPVIALAPLGGKFNGGDKERYGKIIKDFKDPFVFSTCDVVCKDTREVAEALKSLKDVTVKDLNLIPESIDYYLDKSSGTAE